MATCAEDYLIDDDIPVRQFSGTLTFSVETASSQAAVDGMEATSTLLNYLLIGIHSSENK